MSARVRWGALAVGLALAACSEAEVTPTEVVVEVDSDLAVPSELDFLEVRATGPDGRIQSASAPLGSASPLPKRVRLRHSEGALGPLTVVAEGRRDGGSVVSQRGELAFVAHRRLSLRLRLLRACLGADCGADTCHADGCGTPVMGADDVPDVSDTPDDAAIDGVAPDAAETDAGGLPDARSDGGTSAASAIDAGAQDAGPRDAGPRDAGSNDAGPRDAGPRDAGPRDGGPVLGLDGCVPSASCVMACEAAPPRRRAEVCACVLTCT